MLDFEIDEDLSIEFMEPKNPNEGIYVSVFAYECQDEGSQSASAAGWMTLKQEEQLLELLQKRKAARAQSADFNCLDCMIKGKLGCDC